MEEKHKHNSSNGFLLGMIVGGGLFFLLGTKKGRKVLKELSQKGIDVLEEMSKNNLEFTPENEDEIEEDDFEESEMKEENVINPVKNGQPSKKRLFRGIRKK